MKKQPEYGWDLSKFVGHRNTEEIQKLIKSEFEQILSKQPGVDDFSVTKCDKLWNTMTLKEKAKWSFYNFLFPFKGRRLRDEIEAAHLTVATAWKAENPEAGWDECPYHLEYPNYLQSNPKSIIVVQSTLKLAAPLQFIPITIEIPK